MGEQEQGRIEVRDLRGDFLQMDNAIIRDYGRVIGAVGIAVYAALCYHAKHTTQEAWPSISTLAEEIGFKTTSPVQKALKQFSGLQMIFREPRYRHDGGRTSDRITLLPLPHLNTPKGVSDDTGLGVYTDTEAGVMKEGGNNTKLTKRIEQNISAADAAGVSVSPDESPVPDDAAVPKGTPGEEAVAEPEPEPQQSIIKPAEVKALQKRAQVYFERVTGLREPANTPKSGLATLWYNPLKELVRDLAEGNATEAKELIDEALARMRESNLTISSPRSILQVARAVSGERRLARSGSRGVDGGQDNAPTGMRWYRGDGGG